MRSHYLRSVSRLVFKWRYGLCPECYRSFATAPGTIAEGDRVLLYGEEPNKDPLFTKPLQRDARIDTHKGWIDQNGIIGKRVRDIVTTNKGRELRVQLPTLGDYVTMTARRVTPIYPADANLIVSLLDIHASIPSHISPHHSRIEILEAGTGHGALTLHLARAIHSTNPPLPVAAAAAPEQPSRGEETSAATMNSENNSGVLESPPTQLHGDPDLERWRASRRAIIHSLDISAENSTHASQIVSGFRRGLYAGNVDFHVGDVSEWISKELEDRTKGSDGQQSEAFLSHILLDLPAAQLHLERISSTLRVDGVLTVFNPSITQITACVEVIREKRLPLVLDRVVELGPGMTGGREWDVRAVRPRAVIKAQSDRAKTLDNAGEEGRLLADVSGEKSRDEEQVQALATHGQRWELVCRPKVGGRVFGGGFLGVWRRMRHRREGK